MAVAIALLNAVWPLMALAMAFLHKTKNLKFALLYSSFIIECLYTSVHLQIILRATKNARCGHTLLAEQKLEMWANAQRDGRPAEHRWRPLFNAAKFG